MKNKRTKLGNFGGVEPPQLPLLSLSALKVRGFSEAFGEFEFPIIPQIGDRVLLDPEFPAQRVVDREIQAWNEDYQLEIKIWVKPIAPPLEELEV
jgi:hypothetical protein